MNKKRSLTLLLAAWMLTGSLASCGEAPAVSSDDPAPSGDTAGSAAEEAGPEETEPADPLAHLPVQDYEGYDFHFL